MGPPGPVTGFLLPLPFTALVYSCIAEFILALLFIVFYEGSRITKHAVTFVINKEANVFFIDVPCILILSKSYLFSPMDVLYILFRITLKFTFTMNFNKRFLLQT
jgi:hypothetical protein